MTNDFNLLENFDCLKRIIIGYIDCNYSFYPSLNSIYSLIKSAYCEESNKFFTNYHFN